MRKVLSFILLFLISANLHANKLDSLLNLLNNPQHDTLKVKLLNDISWQVRIEGDPKRAMNYAEDAFNLAIKIGFQKGLALSLNSQGIIYKEQGDIPKALECYHKSLRIREKIGDKKGVASSFNNLGNIYTIQQDVDKALEYYIKSLRIREQINDLPGIAHSLNNIGTVYSDRKDIPNALMYFEKSLVLRKELGDQQGIANSFNNLGYVYKMQGNLDKALEHYQKSLDLRIETGNKQGVASCYCNLGMIWLDKNNIDKALQYGLKSLSLSQELEYPDDIKYAAELLQNVYSRQSKWKQALEMYQLSVVMRDSINNEETKQSAIRQQLQYEFGKKVTADSVKHASEQKVKDALLASQKAALAKEETQRYALYGGLLLVMGIAGVSFRAFQTKRKANITITAQKEQVEFQKNIVEVKNKEILDSITYAKRLQEAILPPLNLFKEAFPESFIYYQPKDIVAGDFYWMEARDNIVFTAAADCTGHGVPGALVSVVCSNALNRAVKEFGITDPAAILNKVRELVLETFSKSSNEVKDGMDISLCAFNVEGKNLTWAGANSPLWLLRGGEIIEYKPDKQPVGKMESMSDFKSNSIDLKQGDSIYIFTDGYADQFGGGQGKKYKSVNFKKSLQAIQHLNMEGQHRFLKDTFESWKGNMEQVDDVCVIGIKV